MFEKEAEEISNKLVEKGCVAIVEDRARQDMQYAFKKGAELGYNKAKAETKELEEKIEKIKNYLAYEIPHEFVNEATTKIWKLL